MTDKELGDVLKGIIFKLGVKPENIPNDEERLIIFNHLRRYYGNHTAHEIMLAYDMAITGRLDIEVLPQVTALSVSKVLNEYRKWSVPQYKLLVKPEATTKVDVDMSEWLNMTINQIAAKKLEPMLVNEMLYDYVVQQGMFAHTEEQMHQARLDAMRMLEITLAENPTSARYKAFMQMKQGNEFTGAIRESIFALAKKILFFNHFMAMKEFEPIVIERYIPKYLDKPEVIKRVFCVSANAREIMRAFYQYFVNSSQLPDISALPTEQKKHYWVLANRWLGETFNKAERIKLSKALYLLEYLTQKPIVV
jgi:hypothetical protein